LARQLGYTEEEIDAIGRRYEKDRFEARVAIALEYAEKMTVDAHEVTDELFGRLKDRFTDKEILEITCVVGLANYWNRFTTSLRIDHSGTDAPYDAPVHGL